MNVLQDLLVGYPLVHWQTYKDLARVASTLSYLLPWPVVAALRTGPEHKHEWVETISPARPGLA